MYRLALIGALYFNHLFLISKNCGPNIEEFTKLGSTEVTTQICISVFQRALSAAARSWLLSAASAWRFLWLLPRHPALTLKGCTACLRLSEGSPSIPSWPWVNKTRIRLRPEPISSLKQNTSTAPSLHSWDYLSIKTHVLICTQTFLPSESICLKLFWISSYNICTGIKS